jgi:hypothetical protein
MESVSQKFMCDPTFRVLVAGHFSTEEMHQAIEDIVFFDDETNEGLKIKKSEFFFVLKKLGFFILILSKKEMTWVDSSIVGFDKNFADFYRKIEKES